MTEDPNPNPNPNDRRRRVEDRQLRCEDCENFEAKDQGWHMQRGIPAALIISVIAIAVPLVLAAVAAVWTVSGLAADSRDGTIAVNMRVNAVDKRIELIERDSKDRDKVMQDMSSRLVRMETTLNMLYQHNDPDGVHRK
jgi:hypothetical protein